MRTISSRSRNGSAAGGCRHAIWSEIIAAGLRGVGESVTDDEVAAMSADGGAAGYVRIAADLIAATFDDAAIKATR